jgi:ATP-binding cassette subfamily C protein CydD
VLATVSGVLAVAQAALLAHILHGAVIEQLGRHQLLTSFATLGAILLMRAVLSWGREISGQRASTLVRQHVRRKLLERLSAAGPMTVKTKSTAHLANAIIERVEALHGYFAHYLPQRIIAATVPIILILTAFYYSWAVGLIFLITAPLIPAMMIMIGKGAENLSQKNFQLLSRMSAHFLDTLQGLPTLKLFMRSKDEAERIAESSEEYRKGTMSVLRVAFLSSAVLEFFTSVAIAMTAVFLGLTYLHYLDFGLYGHPLNLRTGLMLLLLAPDVYLPLRELGTHFHARADALGAAEALHALQEDLAKPSAQLSQGLHQFSGDSIALELRQVSHHYSNRHTPALDTLSLAVAPGEWLAIVGSSGAGKSTLLNLLLGFLPLQKGEILINGESLTSFSAEEWHQQIGWVPQSPQLFTGNLLHNICLGNEKYSQEQVKNAAEQANLFGCSRLPQGLATEVGEQGNLLSGGQARRVALARAFAKDAPLLLLDEPTAGLDLENERLIMESLKRLPRGKTVIMLTHRLDTARLADRIAVIEGGRLVEHGSHEQLMENKASYAKLVSGGTEAIP